MDLDTALRLTEILLGFALLQYSAEHLIAAKDERRLFLTRAGLCVLLIIGFQTPFVCLVLLGLNILILHRFQGPYNGGSDRMGLLILLCLCLAHLMPSEQLRELAFGYLALQCVLSYFISGQVKIVNPEWRNGKALGNVFAFSVYPVSESLRGWANHPRVLLIMSWAVMVFELLFPFMMITQQTLIIGVIIAAIFHLANAFLFGLNRFFWIWIAAYPSLFWLQARIFEGG